MTNRIDKTNYYLNVAKTVADRSTCLRKKLDVLLLIMMK